ncbi:hypothetical protein AB0F15_23425 [Amycolatopsis sp. NPDC026612]|uniref:hypothetical protein n=1 Tax=Amycolatopsis sp. NPDC026612 TaxID=3155466 RepID=UPI0033CD7846
MNADLSRHLIAGFLLPAGEEILDVRDGTAASIVETSRTAWRVEPLPSDEGYRLFTAGKATMDNGEPVEAFAVLPDGQAFRLGDEEQLRTFHRQASPSPLEIANLVAQYAEPQPVARFLDPATAPMVSGKQATVHTYSWLYPDDETEILLRERWDVDTADPLTWRRTELGPSA